MGDKRIGIFGRYGGASTDNSNVEREGRLATVASRGRDRGGVFLGSRRSGSELTAVPRSVASTAGAYTCLRQYMSATKQKIYNFIAGDYYTEKMKNHQAVVETRASLPGIISNECRASCDPESSGPVRYSLGDKSLIGRGIDFVGTHVGTWTNGVIGPDPDYATVGSLSTTSKWETTDVKCGEGTAIVKYSLSNDMSLSSNTRWGYSNPDQHVFDDNPFGPSGEFGTVRQNWEWQERVSFDKSSECPAASDEESK